MRNRFAYKFLGLMVLFIYACGPSIKVARTDVDTTIDLSGEWNDTDSRLVSEEMVKDVLSRPWVNNFSSSHNGKVPDVIVGDVKNRSHEHINVQTFSKDLERALINSGQVSFVASKGEREQLREERVEQAKHASEESVKGPGHEVGADFMLIGSINTILDQVEGKKVMYYQVNLELVDLLTNRKVWLGEKKIKKFIKKSKVGF